MKVPSKEGVKIQAGRDRGLIPLRSLTPRAMGPGSQESPGRRDVLDEIFPREEGT